MLKRLIEVALPLKEVSEQSAREKSIRHGHISTLHIWWARRPLAACRAVVFASLIPDPDDPECPEAFRQTVREVLRRSEFKPKFLEPSPGAPPTAEPVPLPDTPRNRCIEFIKHLVKWENSNNSEYIEPARRLISAAHKILHPESTGDAPKVLDPFAGGGAIPLEALRLGCEAHAIDINPVAHLIQLCTLVYPQKYGRPLPPDAPVPDYIIEAARNDNEGGLFGSEEQAKTEYRRNPLAADVKYWGNWVLEKARAELAEFYPSDPDGSTPIAYLWARTVKCPNPACGATIPLIRQLWLCKKPNRKVALRMTPNDVTKKCDFTVVEGDEIDFEPDKSTMQEGRAECPFCGCVVDGKGIRQESNSGLMSEQMTTVISIESGHSGKVYRTPKSDESRAYLSATSFLDRLLRQNASIIPDEKITPDRPSPNSRGLSAVHRYGLCRFGDLFNKRQALCLATFTEFTRQATVELMLLHDKEYARAIGSYLGIAVDRLADRCANLSRWQPQGEKIANTFSRQALQMVWDYVELNTFGGASGGFAESFAWIRETIIHCSLIKMPADCRRGSATALPVVGGIHAVVTDPPYYDSVPYSDLSDFFYVWLRRSLKSLHSELFQTPLTPKMHELIAYYGAGQRLVNKPPEWYERQMLQALREVYRILLPHGVQAIMFAHKETGAWESIIAALNEAGLLATASWPLHTEMKSRMVAQGTASLASSVTIICRKREANAGDGLWDDVRRELREVAAERLDFFWNQGIRGADFFISAIGPALSVFGRYERVMRLSGDEVTVGQFLDEVRDLVTHYALSKIVKGGQIGHIDAETQFYVVWKWSYKDAKVPADEAFKLAQALGLDTDVMWDRAGVLEKNGQNVSAVPIAKRTKVKDLGERKSDGTLPSIIDTLHRLCAFREKGDMMGAGEYLSRSGHGNTEALWLVAQAISEILPDGDKEKQLLQGLLNQRYAIQQGSEKKGLF